MVPMGSGGKPQYPGQFNTKLLKDGLMIIEILSFKS